MEQTIVLVHSPLVGPRTWAKLAPDLAARGHRVVVPDLRPALRSTPPYYPVLVAAATQALATNGDVPLLLVGRS